MRSPNTKPVTIKYGPKRADAMKPKVSAPSVAKVSDLSLDTKVFQEKMKMLQYAQLPINAFNELTPAKKYEQLPLSNDRALLTAIEQANEEFEEDEAIRELAVKILAAFRTRNSVEALSQIALYDLSSNLRSKSVSILTDFDHDSVFEAILLACADPTREVRAAAARGLFRLNFDRSDAWKRLIETGDEFRMSHAVRAAVEAGIVQKSLDRLVHEDLKVAYEAFTLVALMIAAGETNEIFDAIREHRDERVKFALLHVIKAVGDVRALTGLSELSVVDQFSEDVVKRINDVVKSFDRVAV
jgi:inorganic triphosphatase YgiF